MTNCKTIAVCNQKGGVAKTTTTVNLGIGLAMQGKNVLLVDADPQGDLTTCLGWRDTDNLENTISDKMMEVIQGKEGNQFAGMPHFKKLTVVIGEILTLFLFRVCMLRQIKSKIAMS